MILVLALGAHIENPLLTDCYASTNFRVKYGSLLNKFTALPVFRTTSQSVSLVILRYTIFSDHFCRGW